jgi:hypothetical protein
MWRKDLEAQRKKAEAEISQALKESFRERLERSRRAQIEKVRSYRFEIIDRIILRNETNYENIF